MRLRWADELRSEAFNGMTNTTTTTCTGTTDTSGALSLHHSQYSTRAANGLFSSFPQSTSNTTIINTISKLFRAHFTFHPIIFNNILTSSR
jgi:hypothetical protein